MDAVAEGSLRNSHRETNPVKRKVAPRSVQENARALVDQLSTNGSIIRQRLDVERMKQPLQKGVFYVAENDGNAEPGFLVFLPQQAPVFLQTRKHAQPPCTLRMRCSPTLSEGGGSVLIATLDSIQHRLRLEDVWMWKGAAIFDTETFSKRRERLAEFVERCWIPDARLLGGIQTTILNPKSVEAAFANPFSGIHTIDLIPEMPGRRRMWICVDGTEIKREARVEEGPKTLRERRPEAQRRQLPVAESEKRPATEKVAAAQIQRQGIAKGVEKMPDIYDVYDLDGIPISRASVQKFSISQQLRNAMTPEGVPVTILWRAEFGGYEIVSLRLDVTRHYPNSPCRAVFSSSD